MPPLESLLACPVDGSPLRRNGETLVSAAGRSYPIIQGVPVLIDPATTDAMALRSLARIRDASGANRDPLFVGTLDVEDAHRPQIEAAARNLFSPVDPIVSQMVAATCGNLYRHLVGKLDRYPIPDFRLKDGAEKRLLDIGCNWGRWCFAAAREGFTPVGIDPQLGAVLAAKRVATALGIEALFVCGDARRLPFRNGAFDVAFSYSVLQHLSPDDAQQVLQSAARTLTKGGEILVQMAAKGGIRNWFQQARRRFRPAQGFEVRYWSLGELRDLFAPCFDSVGFEIDCFFGIGLQPADADLMPWRMKRLLAASERLRKLAGAFPALVHLADSVYVHGLKS